MPLSLASGTSMVQTKPWNSDTVTPQSPAIRVMTDLTLVKPATISPQASLHEAEQVMIFQGVRMLFVVTAMPALDSLITTHDLHGERTTRLVQQRGVRHDELTVADVMNSLTSREAIDLDAVRRSTVANLSATLRRHGRHHMLVVDRSSASSAVPSTFPRSPTASPNSDRCCPERGVMPGTMPG